MTLEPNGFDKQIFCDVCGGNGREHGGLHIGRDGADVRQRAYEAGWRRHKQGGSSGVGSTATNGGLNNGGRFVDSCPPCVKVWADDQSGQEELF